MGVSTLGVSAFANAAALVHSKGTACVLQKRRPALRHANHSKSARVTPPKLCVERNEDATDVQHGLTISRQEVLQRTRSGRALKLRRWARLSEIDIQDQKDARVEVWMVISRDQRDFRVRAKVESELLRVCDRCAGEYVAKADGRFDVVLRTGDAESEADEAELVEALEEFGPMVDEVWMGNHVRDGVYLGVPTKSLCSESCQGVDLRMTSESGSVRYSVKGAAARDEDGGALGTKEAGELLMKLKQRLEKEGL